MLSHDKRYICWTASSTFVIFWNYSSAYIHRIQEVSHSSSSLPRWHGIRCRPADRFWRSMVSHAHYEIFVANATTVFLQFAAIGHLTLASIYSWGEWTLLRNHLKNGIYGIGNLARTQMILKGVSQSDQMNVTRNFLKFTEVVLITGTKDWIPHMVDCDESQRVDFILLIMTVVAVISWHENSPRFLVDDGFMYEDASVFLRPPSKLSDVIRLSKFSNPLWLFLAGTVGELP